MHSNPLTHLLRLLTIISPVLVLMGCFGEGDGKEPIRATPIPPVTGIFVDSPVVGAGWETSAGESGVTNELGEFSYVPGNSVTFSVGGIVLGSAPGAPIITAVELTGSNNPTDQAAVNQFVFLQSIDEDEDPTNGITISSSTQSAAAGQTLDFKAADFSAAVAAVVAAIAPGNSVVSDIEALAHFYTTFSNLGGTDTFSFSFPGFPPTRSGVTYELVFADEFDEGTAPNPETWNYDLGYGDFGWGNNEWQFYTDSPDNIRVEDGNLVIQARCDTPPCGVRDGSVTSGRINTKDKFEFRYGTIIARIKPPVGDGAWPAFWSLGAAFPETSWPRAGEIDFMEMHNAFPDTNEGTAHFTMHWCDETVNPSLPSTAVCFGAENGWIFDSQKRQFNESLGDDYQLFEADWDQDRIIGRINGITYFERQIDPDTMEEFLREFFTILNVAMGGTLGSNQMTPAAFYAQQDREEVWPQTMLVDYVRVFQRTDAPTQELNIDFEDPASEYTFADFGGSGAGQGGRGTVVANPAPEGINTSAQVGQVQKFAGELFAGTTLVTAFDVPAQSAFTMKVWSPRAVNVLFKLEGITPVAETEVTHSGSGWEELTFDLGAFSGTATGITFIFDNGTLGNADTAPNEWTFYVDDITRAQILSQIDLPITFDDPATDYRLTDFGDPVAAMTTLVEDPGNAANTVASTTKPMMAPVWAGTTMSTPAGLASPIPFSANQTTIGVRVYSPAAGIPVRLKADDVVNGSVSVETELLTTVANEWETLVFDFSNQVDGTDALDLDTDYTALSIFFDFDTAGNGATYLWDDVEFGVPVPDTTAPTLTTVSIASSNANPALATTGDVVTVSLTADESITAPAVTIGGIAADSVNGGGADWVASRTLTGDDTDGVVTFSIEFGDPAGNTGDPVSASSDGSSVTLDATAPTVAIVGAPATFTSLDPIAVMFEFSEDVTDFTVGDIMVVNGGVSAFAAVDGANYMANVTPTGSGDLTIGVAAGIAADAAGNANSAATGITIVIDLDADAPLLTVVSISSSPTDGYARTDDVVTIDMTANEDILEPTVMIAGAPADSVTGDGTIWAASRTMLATDTEGEIGFTINFEDLTNNAGPQTTVTTNGSSVIFDVTAPTLSIQNVVDVMTVDPFMATFQFNEDVTGFAAGDISVTNGTADGFASVHAATYTAMITPAAAGDLTVSVAADAATDLAGNGSEGDSVTVSVDLTPFWNVVWSDEFDGTALNPANWTARTDADCPEPCDGVQSYLTERVSVGAGRLTITADGSGPITSGLIDTRGSGLQLQRGRVEIDVKMPAVTGGLIPSLRMLPEDSEYGPWPQSGEIDIINSPAALLTEHTLVYGLPEPEDTTATVQGGLLPGTASTAFLTYAIEWEAGEIRWFVDGVHKASQVPDNWYAYGENEDGVYTLGAGAAPFDRDFYILIGLTIDTVAGSYPQILQVDAVRVYECANGDPETGTGCEGLIDPDLDITPVAVNSPYNGEPYTEELEVYTDVPATLTFTDNAGMTTMGALVPATFNDPGVGVVSIINADDMGNTVWNVDISATAGTGGVLMGPASFEAATGYFDLSGGGTAGEVLFRMRVNPASDAQLSVKLDSDNGTDTGSGAVVLDYVADGAWRQYSVKISDIVTDSVMGDSLDLASIVNLFTLEASGGTANLDLDDITVKVACRVADNCEATPRSRSDVVEIEYSQDFEPPAVNIMDENALSDDGYLVFATVFDSGGLPPPVYTYGVFPAPNIAGPAFSSITAGQGGAAQGEQQLSVYNDYDNGDHRNGSGNRIEASVFRERSVTNDDLGKTITFSFDAKRGNIEGATTANGFIKTLDPDSGFNLTNCLFVDTTNILDVWQRYSISLPVAADDEPLVGQLIQFGFSNTASNDEGSGIFYDNLLIEIRSGNAEGDDCLP